MAGNASSGDSKYNPYGGPKTEYRVRGRIDDIQAIIESNPLFLNYIRMDDTQGEGKTEVFVDFPEEVAQAFRRSTNVELVKGWRD